MSGEPQEGGAGKCGVVRRDGKDSNGPATQMESKKNMEKLLRATFVSVCVGSTSSSFCGGFKLFPA